MSLNGMRFSMVLLAEGATRLLCHLVNFRVFLTDSPEASFSGGPRRWAKTSSRTTHPYGRDFGPMPRPRRGPISARPIEMAPDRFPQPRGYGRTPLRLWPVARRMSLE